MKKLFFRIVAVVLCMQSFNILYCQENLNKENRWYYDVSDQELDFYAFTAKWDKIFNDNPALKEDKNSSYKQYIRWKAFYQTRVNSANGLRGKLYYAAEAYGKYKRPAALKSGSYSQWSFLGPDGTLAGQHMGIVVSLAIDKTVPGYQTIYAGTNAS